MARHFLAINHWPRDSSTVFGVFDTLIEARHHLEAEAAKPDAYSSARVAEIEEWDGARHIATHERDWRHPTLWKSRGA